MSTFLTLCQDLRRKARVSGSGPVSVTGQTGILAELVDAVNEAWRRIQNHPKQWRWMWRADYGLETIATVSDYVLSNVGSRADDLFRDTFTAYDSTLGSSARYKLTFKDWGAYQQTFGALQTVPSGKPTIVTRLPSGELRFYPTPDKVYVVDFEYITAVESLTANADTPSMPAEYHPLIVEEALLEWAQARGATDLANKAERAHARWMRDLIWNQELRRERFLTVRAE